ncbi:MAG: UDP-N-acetylmuramate dehydrogenase [Actinomycetota bacterium]|nr:UDP-N-acetylmuramate dehydrogenase [Actinomycetota bacterium]
MGKIKSAGRKKAEFIRGIGHGKILFNVDTSKLSSIKAGGRALCYFIAEDNTGLKRIIKTCMENKIDYMVVGDCTNILFSDKYIDMVLIKLGRGFNYINFEGENNVRAGAAINFLKYIIKSASRGLDFSKFSGIPGTLGGVIAGNGGTGKEGICDYIKEIDCITNDNDEVVEKSISLSKNDFGYRYLDVKGLAAVTGAVLSADKSGKRSIINKVKKNIDRKKLVQPVKARSSGCFFKNLDGESRSAGELIDRCGLKGFKYGGARVSEKHANYIENFKNASAEDVLVLSRIVRDIVMDKFNKKLEYEVKLVGF